MADEGKPNGKGSPEDDFGSVVARFEQAGVDLRQLDPVKVSKAMALIERAGPNGRVFTAQDVPRVMESYLAEMVADPQGQAYLRRAIGEPASQRPAPRSVGEDVEADLDDPSAQRMARYEQALQEHATAIQRLAQDRDAIARERTTDSRMKEMYGYLDDATRKISGAGPYNKYLRKQLNREIVGGVFSNDLMTPHGVNAWTQSELEDIQAARAAESEAREAEEAMAIGQGGAVSFSDEEAPKTLDEVQEKWETLLPE